MAQIEIIIRDDNGNIIQTEKKLSYELNLGGEKFTEIERAVELFRQRSNKEITGVFLSVAQSKFVKEKKTMTPIH
jgi:hypothetical protein